MAKRLTDRKKKKIVADYLELESYNAVAKLNSVSDSTVKRVVAESGEIKKKLEQKKSRTQKIFWNTWTAKRTLSV